MPGVPFGRGCEACRKSKKKCDQKAPVCSRCMRLQIPCIGCGVKRYKFVEQTFDEPPKSPGHQNDNRVVSPSRNLASSTLVIASAFIEKLEVTDLKHDLTLVYGDFLKHIPQRLGTNEALDAAVGAVIHALPCLYTRQRSREAIGGYGRSLKTLVACLNDPAKAQSVDTLCAIYLIMICEGWIGLQENRSVSHGEGISRILSATGLQNLQDPFVSGILLASSAAVIAESIWNPRVQLGPWLQKVLDTQVHERPKPVRKSQQEENGASPLHSLSLASLARLRSFMRQPESHILEIRSAYDSAQADIQTLHQRMAAVANLIAGEINPSFSTTSIALRVRAQLQAAYTFVLTLAILYSCVLCAFDPFDTVLHQQSADFSNQLLLLSQAVSAYRPLGSSYMLALLPLAWAATNDPATKANLEAEIQIYATDFGGINCSEAMASLQHIMEELRLRLEQVRGM